MMKKYVTLLLLLALFLPASAQASASSDFPVSEQMDAASPVISVRGSRFAVLHAEGLVLEIYNLAGLKVGSYKIESGEYTVTTSLPKGCYILKLGKLVRKISIG